AEEEMIEDGLSIFDMESVVLAGEIIGRRKDIQAGESKYIVKGRIRDDRTVFVVTKIGSMGEVMIITVFEDE
ncbi:MAG: DUF4258 domain-containing protein, partial [Methylococcales bacterium]